MKHLTNKDISNVLYELSALYEMEKILFKPRVYEKAAFGVLNYEEEMSDLYKEGGVVALDAVPGVGKGIAEHIEDLLKKGTFTEHTKFKKKVPVNILELTAVEGVGPQTVKILWKKLKVKNLKDLERVAGAGKIRELPGFGKKKEEKILLGITFLKEGGGRRPLGDVLSEVEMIESAVRALPGVKKVMMGGSVRRWKETIGDIDILVVSKKPEETMDGFVELPFVTHVYGKGKTKTNVRLKSGLDADLRIVPLRSWGAAQNYFTGSRAHNIKLREMAQKKKWKLNEYGLFSGNRFIGGRSEEELYKKLGLPYIEPEMREMKGELEAAREGTLPKLIGYGDLKGDLQIQTNWTDGKNTMEEMALAALKEGLEYIAITDHTRGLAMTGGSDEKRLRRQMKEILKLNDRLKKDKKKITVLTGAEVNILKDGSLDIKDEVLAELDVVGAAVHHHFNLSEKEQTARIIRVMENPHVDIIFHLSARRIGRRKPIALDIDKIIEAAKRTKTILEIDAFPSRLDIKDDYIRKCVEAGVKMTIDSDAHSTEHIKYLTFGIAQARRGWAEKKDIINTLPLQKFLKQLKKNKKSRMI